MSLRASQLPRLVMLMLMASLLAACSAPAPDADSAPGGSGPDVKVTPSIDAETGMVVAPGFAAVRANCGACHDLQLVASQRGDRDFWLGLIRWMQRTQNLWPLAPDTENEILDYLAAHYDAESTGRRRPLPADLRPAVSAVEDPALRN